MSALDEALKNLGGIVLEPQENEMSQYGVPGMKWGVRKRDRAARRAASSEPEEVIVRSQPGKRAVAVGGRNQPPSDDAKRAVAYRQKAAASSVHSLSNKELQDLITRTRLESDYAKILAASNQRSLGRKAIDNFLDREKDAVLKGNKPKSVAAVEMLIKFARARKAAKAASKVAKAIGS